jgi:serine/threonine protein kinase
VALPAGRPSSCFGREVFSLHDLADLEAEARLLGQLLHKNIVSASAASRVEPTRCCLVTELAPFGSLKSVLDKSR